jgi:hypothetical protein
MNPGIPEKTVKNLEDNINNDPLTHVSSDVQSPLPSLSVLPEAPVDQAGELVESAVLSQVVLKQTNY